MSPHEEPRERSTWRSLVFLLLIMGTLVGVFLWTLVYTFADIHPGDPFAVVFAPMAVVEAAAVAIFAAGSVALLLEGD